MMLHRVFIGACVGLSLLVAQPAASSDLDLINAPEIDMANSSVGQGWYIRGDFGYAGAIKGDAPSYRTADGVGGYTNTTFDDERFSKPFSYGAGMGYQFSDYLRADLTADFFNGNLSGSSHSDTRCSAGQPAATGCGFTHDTGFSAIGLMANGYVDLGTVVGFTPYVGAGAGVTHLAWDRFSTNTYCIDGGAACNGTTYAQTNLEGEESWRFSYALMAGVTYDLSNRIKLDVGYRYSDIAGGDTYSFGSAETALGASGAKGTDEGFVRHEVRAGIRINTW